MADGKKKTSSRMFRLIQLATWYRDKLFFYSSVLMSNCIEDCLHIKDIFFKAGESSSGFYMKYIFYLCVIFYVLFICGRSQVQHNLSHEIRQLLQFTGPSTYIVITINWIQNCITNLNKQMWFCVMHCMPAI